MSWTRRHRRALANLGVLALLGVWFVTLAPTAFGGPAAFVEVQGHSMDPTYATGDLVVTRKQDIYEVGDVVAFKVGEQGQVIHRVTGGDGVAGYTLQGDNNPDADPWRPTDAEVIGAEWVHLEQKAWLLHLPREPWFAGLTAGLLTLLVLGWDARPRRSSGTADLDPDVVPAAPVPPVVVPRQRVSGAVATATPPASRRRVADPDRADAP